MIILKKKFFGMKRFFSSKNTLRDTREQEANQKVEYFYSCVFTHLQEDNISAQVSWGCPSVARGKYTW